MAGPERQLSFDHPFFKSSGSSTRELNGKFTELKPIDQLQKLTEKELYAYIRGPILNAENETYGKERNTQLHKMVFLTGGPHKDISKIRDASGMPVYMVLPKYAKAPEIMEALVETSNFLNKTDQDPARVYSEVSDVAHNLALLTALDPKAELKYKEKTISYEDCISELAESLDLEVRHVLLLSAIKYTQRLESGHKDTQAEDDLIRKAIENAAVPYPTAENMSKTYRVLIAIDRMVEQRLEEVAKVKNWNLSASSGNSNHIFE